MRTSAEPDDLQAQFHEVVVVGECLTGPGSLIIAKCDSARFMTSRLMYRLDTIPNVLFIDDFLVALAVV